ncbi:hypothetical protein T11_15017 [Trichinella zimbabwensis]|uniref:Uncharacterized protein n=1 Tax=Trichinella zimbabwensis TaxID=268475 RepID=A0A0V1GIT5_9BILA|nr:hypothetical protein T11_15017 [Trichinella zimbabwensis]
MNGGCYLNIFGEGQHCHDNSTIPITPLNLCCHHCHVNSTIPITPLNLCGNHIF